MSRPMLFEFDASQKQDFVSIMEKVFSRESAERKAQVWDWLFKKTDLSGDCTKGRGTRRGDQTVGACLVLPYNLWINGETQPSRWPVAVGVDPEHRGAGLPLVRSFFNNGTYYGGMPANDDIASLYRRLGMTGQVMLRNYFAPLRPGTILHRRKGLPKLAGKLIDSAFGLVRRANALHLPKLRPSERIGDVTEVGYAFDSLWRRARVGYRLILARDAEYVRWRFLECPLHKYDLQALWVDNVLAGYVVTRLDQQHDRTTGMIVDIFAAQGDIRPWRLLLDAAIKRLHDQGAEQVQLQLPESAWPVTKLKQHGFWMNKAMTLLQLYAHDEDENNRMPCLHRSWYFTRADSDQDY